MHPVRTKMKVEWKQANKQKNQFILEIFISLPEQSSLDQDNSLIINYLLPVLPSVSNWLL